MVLHEPNYGAALGSSKFCLAPLGGGHGQRQVRALHTHSRDAALCRAHRLVLGLQGAAFRPSPHRAHYALAGCPAPHGARRQSSCVSCPGVQIIVSFMGCLPVCIADDVYEPFEPQYNWTQFGVRPAESDIPELHTILESVSAKEYAAKQVCVAERKYGTVLKNAASWDPGNRLMPARRAAASC